jgi:2-polyprenyl-6-hydroxyphenyl methylase/3-demethylubiquinone-9 3-methyltransferase
MDHPSATATDDISAGRRFAFGRNWAGFAALIDETRIDDAVSSLRMMLGERSLQERTFLDAGCGSGLF